jgi:hypothetical protein
MSLSAPSIRVLTLQFREVHSSCSLGERSASEHHILDGYPGHAVSLPTAMLWTNFKQALGPQASLRRRLMNLSHVCDRP